MILVVGATGRVGGAAVRALVAAGVPVRALCRDPNPVAGLSTLVEPAVGDVDRPETIRPALDGVDGMFYAAIGADIFSEEANAVRMAGEAGVGRFVMLSSLGVEHGVGSGPMHAPGEEHLRSSGLRWTILRPIEFMSNALRWRDTIAAEGVVMEPTGTGRRAMIDPGDIGAVAAAVLVSTGDDHDGKTYDLTGPEALSTAEYVATLSAAIGRPIRHEDIPAEVLRERYRAMGMPPPVIESVVGFYTLIAAGGLDAVSGEVERLLRRPARTFRAWAEENADAFA